MKSIIIFIFFIFTTTLFAQSRSEVERILNARGMSLSSLEAQGDTLILGENTGHGRIIQFSEVKVLLTKDQAVLKREIESASFSGQQTLDQLESVRFAGQYILKSDVAGAIIKK